MESGGVVYLPVKRLPKKDGQPAARQPARFMHGGNLPKEVSEVGVETRMRRLAGALERCGLYVFCTNVLAENAMLGELGEFAKRVGKIEKPGAQYAKMVASIVSHDEGGLGESREALREQGPWGLYLRGRALGTFDEEGARADADWLAGKTRERSKVTTSAGEGSIASAWSRVPEEEMVFFALKLYNALGMKSEARECLGKLRDLKMEYYWHGVNVLKEEGAELEGEGAEKASRMHDIAYRTGSTIQYLKGGSESKYRFLLGSLRAVEMVVEEGMEEKGWTRLGLLMGEVEKYAGEIAGYETDKIEGARFMASSGKLEDMKRARDALGSVDFEMLAQAGVEEGERGCYLEIAEAAAALEGNMEAQEFAGGIYAWRADVRAFGCAIRLIEGGRGDEARAIAANAVAFGRDSGREWMEGARAFAEAAAETDRALGMRIYRKIGEKQKAEEIARRLIEAEGSAGELAEVAREIGEINKRGPLMGQILDALMGMGEEGKLTAFALRQELGLPALRVVV